VYRWWDNTGLTATMVTNEETTMSHYCHTTVTLVLCGGSMEGVTGKASLFDLQDAVDNCRSCSG
jgi:hypothetical protein